MNALPFTTPLQFVALALTLLAGWLLGLASSSAGRKWRERFEEEREAHNATRDRAREELTAANRRVRELEGENARLETALAERQTAAVPVPDPAVSAQERSAAMRSWFYGGSDILSRIHGIDEAHERMLDALGIRHFRDIEALAPEDERSLEDRLNLPRGTIAAQQWREQARLLRAGHIEEHARRFG